MIGGRWGEEKKKFSTLSYLGLKRKRKEKDFDEY